MASIKTNIADKFSNRGPDAAIIAILPQTSCRLTAKLGSKAKKLSNYHKIELGGAVYSKFMPRR